MNSIANSTVHLYNSLNYTDHLELLIQMNDVLNNSVYSEKEATCALIEMSQEKGDDKQINFDVELKKWMKVPRKSEISVVRSQQSPVRKVSRPSTASGSRPRSAKSDYPRHKQEIHGKEVLVKKVSIDAALGPLGFNFMQVPNLYKLNKRSNSLRVDHDEFHVSIKKSKVNRINSRLTSDQVKSLSYKQKFKREKFFCLDIQKILKFAIKY